MLTTPTLDLQKPEPGDGVVEIRQAVSANADIVESRLREPRAGIRLLRTNDLAIPDLTWLAVPFPAGSEWLDPTGMHDTATNNTRITIAETGWYQLSATAVFDLATGACPAGIRILLDGTIDIAAEVCTIGDPGGGAPPHQPCLTASTLRWLVPGDYLEMEVWHNAGAAMDIKYVAELSPVFTAIFLGA